MKKINFFIGLLIGLSILSCSSDDDDDNSSGFNLRGTNYSTPNGHLLIPFDSSSNDPQAIYLSNSVVNNNEWYGHGCDYDSNLTQSVIFYIWPTKISELTDGTYTFGLNQPGPYLNSIFFNTEITVLDTCVLSGNSVEKQQLSGGSLRVQVSGNIYTIDYSFDLDNFEPLKGSYSGELQLVQDFS